MEEWKLPEHFEAYAEGRKAGFLKMKAAKEASYKVAGFFCTFTPLEVLDAAGLLCVSLCGMSNETIPAAETVLPKNLCPLIKSSYGFAITDTCPYTYWADLIVGETTCDGKKKMYDLLGQRKPMYILQLPQGIDRPYARRLWVEEIRRFIAFVGDTFQVEITHDKLRQAAVARNELRRARVELMELQRRSPAPISGLKLYKFMEGLGYSFNVGEAVAATRALAQELANAQPAGDKGAKRVLITGCPIGGVLEKVVGAVERNGGQVVCYENCSGIKSARSYVDTERADMAEALADAYLDIGCSVMSPNRRRMEALPKLIEEFGAEGVIDVTLQTCTTYMIETRAVRKLCEGLHVPYMSMETDYSQEDGGQIETRISAFLETLC